MAVVTAAAAHGRVPLLTPDVHREAAGFIFVPTRNPFQRRFALLVGVGKLGVGKYPHYPPDVALPACPKDVDAVRQRLIDRFGFQPEDIGVVLDDQATAAGVEAAFRHWLIDLPQAGDLALFYFSGHGTLVSGEGGAQESALCPTDARADDAAHTIRNVLPYSTLSGWLAESKAECVALILDCCHAGTTERGLRAALPVRRKYLPAPATDTVHRRLLGWRATRRHVLLAACRGDEEADSLPDDSRSGFTAALLECFDHMPHAASWRDVVTAASRWLQQEGFERQHPEVESVPADLSDEACLDATTDPAPEDTAVDDHPATVCLRGFDDADAQALSDGLAGHDVRVVSAAESGLDRYLARHERGAALCTLDGRIEQVFEVSEAAAIVAAVTPALERVKVVRMLRSMNNPAPPFKVSVALRPAAEQRGIGDLLAFEVKSERAGYLYLLNVGTTGAVTLLFPNHFHPDSRVEAGQDILIPPDADFRLRESGPPGQELVKAVVTSVPLSLPELEAGNARSIFRSIDQPRAFVPALADSMARALGGGRRGKTLYVGEDVGQWSAADVSFDVTAR
jgi:hypothetical protein